MLMRRLSGFTHIMYELCALGDVAGTPVWRIERSDVRCSTDLWCAEVVIERCLYLVLYVGVSAALSVYAVLTLRCTHSALFGRSKRPGKITVSTSTSVRLETVDLLLTSAP